MERVLLKTTWVRAELTSELVYVGTLGSPCFSSVEPFFSMLNNQSFHLSANSKNNNSENGAPYKLKKWCSREHATMCQSKLTCVTGEVLMPFKIKQHLLSISPSFWSIHSVVLLFLVSDSMHSKPISAHTLTCSNCVPPCDVPNLLLQLSST
jgi:hypothetical protein